MFVAADVRDPDGIDAVVAATVERFGRIDVLVNNAGGGPPADSATVSPKFSTAIINLNLIAPLVFAQRANAVMQQQDDGGVIINIASVSGIRPSPNTAAYGAAKAGLLNLTQTLAVDYAPKVRVDRRHRGLVETEQSHLFYGDEAGVAAVGRDHPARPHGQARGHRRRLPVPRFPPRPLRQRHLDPRPRRRRAPRLPPGLHRRHQGLTRAHRAQGCWLLTETTSPVM